MPNSTRQGLVVNQVAFDSAQVVGGGATAREKKCSACVGCFQLPVNRRFEIGTYLVHIWRLGKAGKFSPLLKKSSASDDSFVRCWCGISARICRTK